MFIPKIEISLTPHEDTKPYSVDINQRTLDILSLIFQFKISAAPHIARFSHQPDQSKYLYLKLRRMWQAGLLESLQVSMGTRRRGMPVYYMLSRAGLKVFAEQMYFHKSSLASYPTAASFITAGLFKHEAEIVELASLEAKNNSEKLTISFTGETDSMTREMRSDKRIEVLTPDYIVWYVIDGISECVYTEFERTNKSPAQMMRKIDRYVRHFASGDHAHTTIRIIFESQNMEASFWLNILLNKPRLLQGLRLVTTHVSLVQTPEQFLQPIYATEESVNLRRDGRVTADLSERVRLCEGI